ncbi:hypothetical protein Trisim1_012507 [Trichoderma cf. simile WF8]
MQRATVQWRLPPEYLDPAAGLGPYTCYFLHVQPPSKSSILVQLTSWLLGSSTLFACRQRYASSPTPKTGAPAADAIRSLLKRGKQQSRGRGAHQAVLAASAVCSAWPMARMPQTPTGVLVHKSPPGENEGGC